MNAMTQELAYRIGEGLQAAELVRTEPKENAFHRSVIVHETSDLSFISGLISTGLRGCASVEADKLISNYNQLLTASRQHLPLVVSTNAQLFGDSKYATSNNYSQIHAIEQTGCFQLVANSPQEMIFLTLIAHRISELSLIPGMVIADYKDSDTAFSIPDDALIVNYLGDPDDQIDCPTPAQEMIFGASRRRIPNWFSFDSPVMMGVSKDEPALSFEGAATQKYFYGHLPELMARAFNEFKVLADYEFKPLTIKGKSSGHALVTLGQEITGLFEQLPESKRKVELIQINQLNPFPLTELVQAIKGKKSVTILENISGSGSAYSPFYVRVLSAIDELKTKVYSAKYSSDLDKESLEMAIQHMISDQEKTEYYLGIKFTKASSPYPKHQILLQEIEKHYPSITGESIDAENTRSENTAVVQDELPLKITTHRDQGPNYSRLSRFHDDTAFFYEHNEPDELTADPFAAVPLMPVASAGFFSQTGKRASIPVFNSTKCTACGDCFTHCPHSAIPPIAIGVEDLMKAGIGIASQKGITITRLTPMIKNLAKVVSKSMDEGETTLVGDFLPKAFESLTIQMKLEGEKLEAAQTEFNAVMAEIGAFSVAVTDQFFNIPSAIEAGKGEFFALAVNPLACTGCSLCAQVCEEEALIMEAENEETLANITNQYRLWERLPDTSGETINRLHHDKDYPSLAAMLLSRNFYLAMSGGNDSEKDSPYKSLLHIITAVAESVLQPKMLAHIKRIEELVSSLSENVHKKLSEALPDHNLESLSKSLKKTNRRKVHIQDLVNQMDQTEQGKFVDSEDLVRKTDLVEDLNNLKWVLSEGPSGVGRSRFGMLLAGSDSMNWARQYPSNHFSSPCIIHWNGSAPDQTLGLFHGQLRYQLDHIKLMRRAELESKDKYDPSVHDPQIATLTWDDLMAAEKQLIPPILLVAERADLNESGWNKLNTLLMAKYPVKVFLLDHIVSPDHSPVAAFAQTASGLITALALKNAFIFQGGMGNTDHLFEGLWDGLERTYPALFNLHAVKYEKHGISSTDTTPYAGLALNSRAFPSLRYDPEAHENFLNGAIELDGNKAFKENWVQESIPISNGETFDYKICWADWAYTQSDWKNQFTPVEERDENKLIPDYLQLDEKSRKEQVPVIVRAGENGLKYYAASASVVEMCAAVLSNWNILQELAGVLTAFPQKLKAEVQKELSRKYEQEVAELVKNHDTQLKEQEAGQTEILRQRLKEKLIALSMMAQNKPKN